MQFMSWNYVPVLCGGNLDLTKALETIMESEALQEGFMESTSPSLEEDPEIKATIEKFKAAQAVMEEVKEEVTKNRFRSSARRRLSIATSRWRTTRCLPQSRPRGFWTMW